LDFLDIPKLCEISPSDLKNNPILILEDIENAMSTENYENSDKAKAIVEFLEECVVHNWDLDTDEIKHVLKQDFEHVRNCGMDAPEDSTANMLEQ